MLSDSAALDDEAQTLGERSAGLFTQLQALVADNAQRLQDQADYQTRYDELRSRYDDVKQRLSDIADEKTQRLIRREKILAFIDTLQQREVLLVEFDENLWRSTVDQVVVHSDSDVEIIFRDGKVIHCDVRMRRYERK